MITFNILGSDRVSKNIVELMKQEIINRSNKFEEETKGTKDE